MTSQHGSPELPPAFPLAAAWGDTASAGNLVSLLAGARGRLAAPAVGDPAWCAAAGPRTGQLQRDARAERGTPWPQPLVSHYARYFRDGNRTAYEGLVGARQQRLTRAVVLALAAQPGQNPDPEGPSGAAPAWLDEVIDGAFLLCEQSSWSWAAHEDVFTRTGDVLPDLDRPYLDLGAGEVVAQLAWLDLVLGAELDGRAPGLRRRIRDEVQARVIRPFLDRLDWHWLGLDGDVHNWNPWIHSNLLAAALFLVDDPGVRALTVARCIEGLDRFLAAIPADGAIDEGFAYWWNGAGRALEGLSLLTEAAGGALDADLPVVREMAAFPHRMHIGGSWYLNVADGPAQAAPALPWSMLRRWAGRLGDADAAAHAEGADSGEPAPAAGLGRMLRPILAAGAHGVAAGPSVGEGAGPGSGSVVGAGYPLVPFAYLPSVQVMVARETAGSSTGLFLAAKGGHNGEHHNHRDVGSVVVAVDGVPLLVDAGQPTYTAQTFGPDRYSIRAMQSAWHSVPAPAGQEQGTGKEFAAHVVHVPAAGNPVLGLELGAAYGLAPGQWVRTAALDRDARQVRVTDTWDLAAAPQEGAAGDGTSITYLAAGTVRIGTGAHAGTATISPAGIPVPVPVPGTGATPGNPATRGAALRWEPESAVVLVDEWQLDDPLLAGVWGARLTRLRFRMSADNRAAGAFTLTVEATP
ncbi:heparinase [Arthrobacter sp. G.S.26]|uniref:heparinase n=1 Tax=Arthrobacter sp. G.S.26 TaxID=3433706 RepID=UPI003D76B1AC